MFKHLQTKALLLLLVLVGGVTTASADEQAVLPNTQALTTEFANVGTDSNIQIKTSSANSYTNPLRIYANTTVTIQAVSGFELVSVTYEASSTGNYVTNAQNATVEPDVEPNVSEVNVTWTLPASTTEFTFTPSVQTRANSITIVYKSSSSTPTPRVVVQNANVSLPCEGGDGIITVEYANITEIVADVAFFAADGKTQATYDWITADMDEDNNVNYLVEANEGEARTAYLKVWAYDDDHNEVYSNMVTITQAAYVAPVVITEGSYVKVTSADELTDGQYLIVYELSDGDGAGLAFDGSLETLDAVGNSKEVNIANGIITATADIQASAFTLASTEGGFTIASASGLYIGQTSDANGLKSSDETAYTNTISFNEDETANLVSGGAYLRYNSASDQLRFRYYKSTSYTRQKAIALYKFVEATTEEAPKATIGDAQWATYVATANVSFPTGCSAYIATAINEASVTLTKVDAVAEGTPVVLNGEQGEYELEAVEEADCDNVNANMLRVVSADEAYTIKSGVYVLTRVNGTVGFYAYEGTNGLPEGRVYLQPETVQPEPGQSRNFLSLGNSEATGIVLNNAENGMSTEVFDLQGRRVEKVQKGLYIVNGKKMIIK